MDPPEMIAIKSSAEKIHIYSIQFRFMHTNSISIFKYMNIKIDIQVNGILLKVAPVGISFNLNRAFSRLDMIGMI